jgi:hypothetical protein
VIARPVLGFMLLLAFVAIGCRRDPAPTRTRASAASPATLLAEAGPARLPEDPVEARKATAQWTEHLIHEERERKQQFDRSRTKEHEAFLSALEKARARYDAAKTRTQVQKAEAQFRASLPTLKREVLAIDPDRQSSNLLEDYQAILAAFDGPYAAARLASLDGDAKTLAGLAGDVERRLAKARAWLAEDAGGEHERLDDHDDDERKKQ